MPDKEKNAARCNHKRYVKVPSVIRPDQTNLVEDRSHWDEQPHPTRSGWLQITCKLCGGFISNRPIATTFVASCRGEQPACSVGECSRKAELYEHDGGIFAYCKIHAVGTRLPTSEQPHDEN